MNRFLTSLADACQRYQLDEKWLVTPAYRVGHQWLETIARHDQPVVNLRLKTLSAVAVDLAGPSLAADGSRLLSPLATRLLVSRLLDELRRRTRKTDAYLSSLQPSHGLVDRVARTIHDLRLAGLTAGDLKQGRFEAAAKGSELLALLKRYERALKAEHLVDQADLYQRAITAMAGKHEIVLLVPEDIEPHGLARQLLDRLPAAHRETLPVDEPAAPAVTGMFHAMGEVNEIRQVLRQCVADNIPLDQVELVHTDREVYVPLVYELVEQLRSTVPTTTGQSDIAPAFVTFADGIPARYARPGRALTAWLNWIAEDFPQPALVAMVQDDLLVRPTDDHDPAIGPARLASVLNRLQIGFGRDRYLKTIDADAARLAARRAELDTVTDEDGNAPDPGRRDMLDRQLETLAPLRTIVAAVLDLSPDDDATATGYLAAARDFIADHVQCVNELDRFARDVLLDQIDEFLELLKAEPGETSIDAVDWLRDLAGSTRVLGLGPRPGCLHVAGLAGGGHSGRPHTFVLGLDNRRFPAAGRQDPVLLDGERQALSSSLATAAESRAQVILDFQRLLARVRGQLTLSYPSQAITDDTALFPSTVFIEAFRHWTGQPTAGESDILSRLGPAAAFAPADARASLDESDWWRWRLCVVPVKNPDKLIAARFPHLADGWAADEKRDGEVFTAYDGFVPDAGDDLDPVTHPERQLSSSSLETLGACPLRYLFRYGFGIEPPDRLDISSDHWLAPTEFGMLMHDVFQRFMKPIVDDKRRFDPRTDPARMTAILTERIDHYRDKFPPATEGLFRRDRRRLERAARIFLAEEEAMAATSRPVAIEADISLVPVSLPDGAVMHVRGRIDRIDETDGGLVVWDYKSGNPAKYAGTYKDPLLQGRVLQHALYLELVRARFDQPACRFGFFFPTERGRGERLAFEPAQLTAAPAALGNLRAVIKRGAFLATDSDSKDCWYCDYRAICRDPAAVAAASTAKLQHPANSILTPYRELRGYE